LRPVRPACLLSAHLCKPGQLRTGFTLYLRQSPLGAIWPQVVLVGTPHSFSSMCWRRTSTCIPSPAHHRTPLRFLPCLTISHCPSPLPSLHLTSPPLTSPLLSSPLLSSPLLPSPLPSSALPFPPLRAPNPLPSSARPSPSHSPSPSTSHLPALPPRTPPSPSLSSPLPLCSLSGLIPATCRIRICRPGTWTGLVGFKPSYHVFLQPCTSELPYSILNRPGSC